MMQRQKIGALRRIALGALIAASVPAMAADHYNHGRKSSTNVSELGINTVSPAALGAVQTNAGAMTSNDSPGANLKSLLDYAQQHNPELAAMRYEAEAAAERIEQAGALPDPKFRVELQDITRMGEQNPTIVPSKVGSTKYLLMQDIPWYGKRELKREIAELEANSAKGRAHGIWADISARLKIAHAQRYYITQNAILTQEILDLMVRLEKIAQTRYASGLATQQDVIRAQVEQTAMRNELLSLDNERHHLQARINNLLARPTKAPLAEPLALRPLPSPAQLDQATLEDRLRNKNPRLFDEHSSILAAEKNRDLVYKNRYPDFTVGVSPIQYGSSVPEWELMLEMNIPLQQSSRRAQEREADAKLAAARVRKEASTWQLFNELTESLGGIELARQTAQLANNQMLPQAKTSYRAALAGYENGKVDFATLLDAQRQIRQAKLTHLKAQVEAQLRLTEIEKVLGEDL